MNVHEFVGSNFNMKHIKEMVINELEILSENHDDIGENGIYVFDIVSGRYGQYQQETIAEFFGINLDEDGIADNHDFIRELENYLTDFIGLNGNFYFGYLEFDNSFGLFYNE